MHLVFIAIAWLAMGQAANAAPQAVSPEPRKESYTWMSLARWYEMHTEDVALAAEGESKLVFLGDSITEAWQLDGRRYWEEHFAPRGAVDFGISGDMTQNLLWRLQNGAAGALDPSAVVLLIGVNNTSFSEEPPSLIAQGVIANVDLVERLFPAADILLLAVFPTGENADDPKRESVRSINEGIQHLGERERVSYLDLADTFLEKDGSLSPEIMPDFLHLSEEGYRRWADAILPWVDERVPLPDTANTDPDSGPGLPHAFVAGWKGEKTCQVIFEGINLRVGQCTFPPGVGHERHFHNPHWGYTLTGSTLRITDADGERVVTTRAGLSWSSDVRTEHEAVNIGEHSTSYIIVEPQ